MPAYAESLERMVGSGAMPRLLQQLHEHADDLLPLARRLFGNWLELLAGVPARAIG